MGFTVGIVLLVGCSLRDPYERKVESRTPVIFAMWRNENRALLTVGEWKAFDTAIQELKYHASYEGGAEGAVEIDERVRQAVDGKDLRSVILEGLGLKWVRFEKERAEMEKIISANAHLRTRPDDTDSSNFLDSMRSRHDENQKRILHEIETVTAQITAVKYRRP